MNDIFKQLKDTLTQTYQRSLLLSEKNRENKGYTRGLKQAVDIVDSFEHKWESSSQPSTSSGQIGEQDGQGIHRLSAQEVCALKLNTLDTEENAPFSTKELIEAAFRFENELMATLGDANTIPIETYEPLDVDKLIHIIVTATEKIVQLQQDG